MSPRVGLTFANGLRSILRQDPDVIMVGEIRDRETAEIAVQASLTGHLVLSTLHTNDAPSAVARMLEMGVEPYLAASSLMGVLAQRLVRTICPHCREEYAPAESEAKYFANGTSAPGKLWRGTGCDKCNGTGYLGRIALFELLVTDDELRGMITERAPAYTIKTRMKGSLRADGLMKAREGLTTLEEVLRVTQTDNADI